MIIFMIKYFKNRFGIEIDAVHMLEGQAGVFEKWENNTKYRRLDDGQIMKIQKYIGMGYSYSEISRRTGVTRRTISRIAERMAK